MLAAAILPTAGCWDRRELEDEAFIQTIGIDKGLNNQLLVTFRIAIPSKAGLGQTAGGGGGGEGSVADQSALMTSINAPSIPAAITLASGYVNRELNLVHTKAVIIGEAAAREGITPLMSILARYREMRRNIFICVSKGEAHDFIKNNTPELEKSYVKWWEGVKMLQARESIHYGSLFHEFVSDVTTRSKEGVMTYLAINKEAKKEDPTTLKSPPSFNRGELNVKAGEIPRTGGNPAEFVGSAVFKGDKLVDVLTLDETRSLLLLSGRFKTAFITVQDPRAKDNMISVEIEQGSPPDFQVDVSGEKVRIKERLSLEGDLISMLGMVNLPWKPVNLQLLENIVEKEIERRAKELVDKLQRIDTDAVGFGDYVRKHCLTRPQWLQFDWPAKFKDAEIEVEVSFHIRRTGMQRQSEVQGE